MERVKLATVWLGGCSGCHMSFLDLDEWLMELAGLAELVYSPLVDTKVFPEGVDVTLIEGAVANQDNLEMVQIVRQRSKAIVAFGDCAVTGNVTALRNPLGRPLEVIKASYLERGDLHAQVPEGEVVPPLLEQVYPVHQVVPVEVYLPGCPPPADRIRQAVEALIQGRPVQLEVAERKFG